MVRIPQKALKEENFKIIAKLTGSSHDVSLVEFEEEGYSKPRRGYFKRLEPVGHFPELLAKTSVAVSAIISTFCNRGAEERLVFDKNGNICGILSLQLDNFQHFFISGETSDDPNFDLEKVIPSTDTLIKHNVIELLLNSWFLGNDDAHPHNMGLEWELDRDMFLYWLVVYMKGYRPVVPLPQPYPILTVLDYEKFPCPENWNPYHWATYKHPGEKTIPSALPNFVQKPALSSLLLKAYVNPKSFAQLAARREAHDQKEAGVLKILTTFQPQQMRQRLTSFLESLALNYSSLPVDVRKSYDEKFPELFNAVTNQEPFIDFMMNVYQLPYNSLYRTVVFHMGCQDNGYGVSLSPTHEVLYCQPSIYKNIETWVKHENATTHVNSPYNLEELQKRYHQIWRDANTLRLRDLVRAVRNLTYDVMREASTGELTVEEEGSKQTTDTSLTSAWQLLGVLKEVAIKGKIAISDTNPLKTGLELLIEFTNEVQAAVKSYYTQEIHDLSLEKNKQFSVKIKMLCEEYKDPINNALSGSTLFAKAFDPIISSLSAFAEEIDFDAHLKSTEESIKEKRAKFNSKKELLPMINPVVIAQFNEELFLWVNTLSANNFKKYIKDVIETKYAYVPTIASFVPSPLALVSPRQRAQPVMDYLNNSQNDATSNADKLAYILSSSSHEDGALNTAIIKELSSKMLNEGHYVASVTEAHKANRFEQYLDTYVKAVVVYAKGNQDFVNIRSEKGIELFFRALYDWVSNEVKQDVLDKIIAIELDNYKKAKSSLSTWGILGNASRNKEITDYFREYPPAKALALTFMNGDSKSSANKYIFQALIDKIKEDLKVKPGLSNKPGYDLIEKFSKEDTDFYLSKLKNDVTIAMSHQIKEPQPA